jgi:protein CpxP
MKRLILAGLALQLYAAPAFAQSTPSTTPSTPPVTTPPPPAVHPPTGGPNSLPTAEPANAIDTSGVTPGANSFTEAQARSRLRDNGYSEVSALTKDQNGIWRGSAIKNGSPVHVSVDFKGHIASN